MTTMETIMPNMFTGEYNNVHIEPRNSNHDGSDGQSRDSSDSDRASPQIAYSSPFSHVNGNDNNREFRSKEFKTKYDGYNGETEGKRLYPGIYVVSYQDNSNDISKPSYGRKCSVIKRPANEENVNENAHDEYFPGIVKKEPPDKRNIEKQESYDRESVISSVTNSYDSKDSKSSDEDSDSKSEVGETTFQNQPRKRAKRIYIYNPKPIVQRPTALNDDKTKDEAYWRHRHYNNAAARRSRANRRAKEMEIMNQASILNENNKFLTARVKELEAKNDYLKSLLLKQSCVNISDL